VGEWVCERERDNAGARWVCGGTASPAEPLRPPRHARMRATRPPRCAAAAVRAAPCMLQRSRVGSGGRLRFRSRPPHQPSRSPSFSPSLPLSLSPSLTPLPLPPLPPPPPPPPPPVVPRCQPPLGCQFKILDDSHKWFRVRNSVGEEGLVPSNYLVIKKSS